MDITEISVFHFSGKVSPRDFFHCGFGTLWTGEQGRDWDTFSSRLVEEQYSKGHVPKEDLKKMHEAVRLWKTCMTKPGLLASRVLLVRSRLAQSA